MILNHQHQQHHQPQQGSPLGHISAKLDRGLVGGLAVVQQSPPPPPPSKRTDGRLADCERPAPATRVAQNVNKLAQDTFSHAQNSLIHGHTGQPEDHQNDQHQHRAFETFIMTGQKMLKLSPSETLAAGSGKQTTASRQKISNGHKASQDHDTLKTADGAEQKNSNQPQAAPRNLQRQAVIMQTISESGDQLITRAESCSPQKQANHVQTPQSSPSAAPKTPKKSPEMSASHEHEQHITPISREENSTARSSVRFRRGLVNRKRTFEARGKPTGKGRRGWRRISIKLVDLRLVMRPTSSLWMSSRNTDDSERADLRKPQETYKANDGNDNSCSPSIKKLSVQDLKHAIPIHHSFAKRSSTYTKRQNVFHLRLADQSEFLIEANDEQDLNSWVEAINFAAACLSSPAITSPVNKRGRSSKGTQLYRTILPASYTKLAYWDQLVDHEERLQKLKSELESLFSRAPNTKTASKRHKSDYFDKIARIRQEIERYSAYVELMRKKSNSPEAIMLSKHPQIASLKPSEKMIQLLPSFAPSNSADNATSSA